MNRSLFLLSTVISLTTAGVCHAEGKDPSIAHESSTAVVEHKGSAVVPHHSNPSSSQHSSIEVKKSKKGKFFGKGSPYGKKHRAMIKEYQNRWNSSKKGDLNAYLDQCSPKQRQAILAHAQKHHGKDAAITKHVEQYIHQHPNPKTK